MTSTSHLVVDGSGLTVSDLDRLPSVFGLNAQTTAFPLNDFATHDEPRSQPAADQAATATVQVIFSIRIPSEPVVVKQLETCELTTLGGWRIKDFLDEVVESKIEMPPRMHQLRHAT